MKTSDCRILCYCNDKACGGSDWLDRWSSRLPTAERIAAGTRPVPSADRPVLLLAHGRGVARALADARELATIAGAFLVAPRGDGPVDLPAGPLAFPAMLVASRNDPHLAYDAADALAADWGALLVDAGEAGSIDGAGGYGPWPEGLTRLATLLKRIG